MEFKVGDFVEVVADFLRPGWIGFKAEVINVKPRMIYKNLRHSDMYLTLKPLSMRPDGFGYTEFFLGRPESYLKVIHTRTL